MSRYTFAGLTPLLLPLTLVTGVASCTPVKENNPEYRYPDQSYNQDSARICKNAVEDRIYREKGRNARPQFKSEDIYASSRNVDEVSGRGVIKDGRRYTDFEYTCDVNIRSRRVMRVDVDYRYDDNHKQFEQLCRDEIDYRIDRDTRGKPRVTFNSINSRPLTRDTLRISGEAGVSDQGRNGEIDFTCQIDTRSGRMEKASYDWTVPLKTPQRTDAKACHQAIVKKAKQDGAQKVSIKSTKEESRSRHTLRIYGDATLRKKGKKWEKIEYSCRINTQRDRLDSANYKYIGLTPNPGHTPMKPPKKIDQLCEKAIRLEVQKAELEDETNYQLMKLEGNPQHTRTGNKTTIQGDARVLANGMPKTVPYTCVYDQTTGKIESLEMKIF